jgi:hypothetical protein
MCGIAGCAGDFVVGLVARMNAAQAHRGPDGTETFEDAAAGVALGHVRLSILDLSPAAAQPMYSPDNRFVLTSKELTWQERSAITDALFDVQLAHNVVITPLVVSDREWSQGRYAVLPIHDEVERHGVAA